MSEPRHASITGASFTRHVAVSVVVLKAVLAPVLPLPVRFAEAPSLPLPPFQAYACKLTVPEKLALGTKRSKDCGHAVPRGVAGACQERSQIRVSLLFTDQNLARVGGTHLRRFGSLGSARRSHRPKHRTARGHTGWDNSGIDHGRPAPFHGPVFSQTLLRFTRHAIGPSVL
jgi:hypothetical protein